MSGQRANLTWLRSSIPLPERLAKTGSRDSLRSGNPTRVLPHEEKMATKMSKRIGPDGIIYFVVPMYPCGLPMHVHTYNLVGCLHDLAPFRNPRPNPFSFSPYSRNTINYAQRHFTPAYYIRKGQGLSPNRLIR